MVIEFIDDHRERFGVARICRFLAGHDISMAESSYYAAKTRPRSARSQRDEVVFDHIVRVHSSPTIGRGLYGARKIWNQLRRESARGEHPELGPVPRCQIERLCAAMVCGVCDATRRSSRPDPTALLRGHPIW